MRESLLPVLRCPRCRSDGALELTAERRDEREAREGTLRCTRCGLERPLRAGIADLLHDPPPFVAREAAGLERFAAVMRADGWDRARILQLPDVALDYWHAQRRAIDYLFATFPFPPGQRLLDVGANTCWASNLFAAAGLDVVALDIADAELQGLRTADWFFQARGTYFERVLSVMFDPALADESFDWVFCCEVLHHNHAAHLRRTLRELYRVLRPGGRLLVVNEPLRFPLRLKRDHAVEVAEFEGHEHVFFLHEYAIAARRAGFRVTLPSLGAAARRPLAEPQGRALPLKRALRRRALGRGAIHGYRLGHFWWRHAIRGDANLTLIGEKPR
jgi:SAM-dependent methyltransferase